MNDQEQAETGNVSPAVEEADIADAGLQETGEMDETTDELDDSPEFTDEASEDAESEAIRSLVEDFFDENDLGEVMSEWDVLTLEDAAAYLKVEYGQIRRLIKEQGLPGRKIGDEWRFLRGAIADWLRSPGSAGHQERPVEVERREFAQRPQRPPRPSYYQEGSRPPRYPQSEGGTRYPQEGRPPRRQYEQQNQGGGQGYAPPPRPRGAGDQDYQGSQGYQGYRPPRRPQASHEGRFENQGGAAGGGPRKFAGAKKPKRKSLDKQRFKRLDRRKFGNDAEQGGQGD